MGGNGFWQIKSALKKILRLGRAKDPSDVYARVVEYEKKMSAAVQTNGNVFIYSLVPWIHCHIEYTLGKIFQYEGYDVTHVICGGGLPLCGMENKKTIRPQCDSCRAQAEGFAKAYKAAYIALDDVVDASSYDSMHSRLLGETTEGIYAFTHDGIPYGRLCVDDYSQYAHAKYSSEDIGSDNYAKAVWIKGIVTQVMLHEAVKRLHMEKRHDIAIVSNGKSFAYTGIYQSLRQQGINTVTWDETPSYYNSFVFKENDYANEIHIDSLFESVRDKLDGTGYREAVDGYFKRWVEDGHHTFKYYGSHISDRETIENELGLELSSFAKIATIYTNVVWDTAALGRDHAFRGMMHWVECFVEAASHNNDVLLLVRAHPAEDKVPAEFRTQQTVKQCLANKFESLPPNVVVIPGASDISSYELYKISEINSVYTTTLGLEMALDGIKPYVAGITHYSGKGFTYDISDMADIYRIFETTAMDNRLGEGPRDTAYRYAYVWLFMSLFRPSNLAENRGEYSFDNYAKIVSPGSEYYRLFEAIRGHETAGQVVKAAGRSG